MADEGEWFVGIDWASENHQVCLVDARGQCVGERSVAHGGAALGELCDWLIARTRARPEAIAVVIGARDKLYHVETLGRLCTFSGETAAAPNAFNFAAA